MKQIDTKKFTKYTLEVILSESDKHFTEISESINKISERSFFLFALYLSLITYSFYEIIKEDYKYLILLFGSIISCLILKNNLFPLRKELKGAKPSDLVIEYFEKFKNEDLEKEYLATIIESYNTSIDTNKDLIKKMVNRYSNSFKNLILFIILFFIFFLYVLIKCN